MIANNADEMYDGIYIGVLDDTLRLCVYRMGNDMV